MNAVDLATLRYVRTRLAAKPRPSDAAALRVAEAPLGYWLAGQPVRCCYCGAPWAWCAPRPGSYHAEVRAWQQGLGAKEGS